MLKIGIADGHPLMCEGIRLAFDGERGFEVIGVGCDSSDAIRIAAEHEPNIMILELDLPGGGLNAVRQIKLSFPKVRVVLLTGSELEANVKAALNLGVHGYVLKDICASDLIKTIRAVAAGETFITPALAMTLLTSPIASTRLSTDVELSAREEQILQAAGRGLKNREIACQLHLSEKTIKNYMSGIFYKLNSRNRVEAVLAAKRSNVN
jgi:two-component system nitrate/nitrite response regulator NarL